MKFQVLQVVVFALFQAPDAQALSDANAGQKAIDEVRPSAGLRPSHHGDKMVALEDRHCENGFKDGRKRIQHYWEGKGSDCHMMLSLRHEADRIKDEYYPERYRPDYREQSYIDCARLAVDEEAKRIEEECNDNGSDHCTGVGKEAAKQVVSKHLCTPRRGGATRNDFRNAREECKAEAVKYCRGNISNIAREWCSGENQNPPTKKLTGLGPHCKKEVDRLAGDHRGDDRYPTHRPTRRPSPSPTDRRPTPQSRPTPRPTLRPTPRPTPRGKCVDKEKPRPRRNRLEFRFKLKKRNAQCLDRNWNRYDSGQFDGVENFSECAERCVNHPPYELVSSKGFRGYDYDCTNRRCRCLYDGGTLKSKNRDDFTRLDRQRTGKGKISRTVQKHSYYCAELRSVRFVDNAVAEA